MTNVIRAELAKLRSTQLWLWALAIAVACGGGLIGILALAGPQNFQPPMPGFDTAEGTRNLLGLLSFSAMIPAIMGTVSTTAEYRHRTATTTFLFAPRRWQVLTAKLLAHVVAGAAYGIALAGSAAIGLYGASMITGTAIGLPVGMVADLLVRLVAAMIVYTLLGVAIGALIPNPIAALCVVVGYFYMLETSLMAIPGVNLLYPYLPGGATAALTDFRYAAEAMAAVTGAGGELLSTFGGALVLLGYVAVAAVLAVAMPMRRDVH